ncbi:chlorite dismutase family protein [Leucobacter chromiireducens]|uniref:Coproheme decarboxylase n=1 Tax=Leucobacter chromiireducens subsp. chromiireducens TaxID=660067 RepID=A0ABS1SKJ1_9MICO|nr:chlorite dismutase family protein [Leucobacter chromiireducens]MBL3688687.1 chlorite dismutase [Leucobacter chromiireducens subsp. chromiireducens]
MTIDTSTPQTVSELPAHSAGPEEIAFALFAVFRLSSSHPVVLDGRDVPAIVQELEDVTSSLAEEGVIVRGWYDVSGLRSDADLMVRLHGAEIEDLQWALRQLRRCALLRPLIRAWSAIGAEYRIDPAEDEALGSTGFDAPADWLACATAEIPDESRLARLVDDEATLRLYEATGLSEADWIVTAEADDPLNVIRLVRQLSESTAAIAAVQPRYTGRSIEPAEIVEVLQ